ncbi:MAG: DNA-directed RNA polymerase subunit D [Candidatus Micrarchaeaceae archaeon]
MKVDVIENTPGSVRFILKDAGFNFANALRRVIMNSVDCFAIDSVTFYENSTAMFDEYIAHRVGLVPILTPKGYNKKDEIFFKLNAEGPITIYSKDVISSDKFVKVANDNIPIMKLATGQKLRFDAKAIMDKGSRSAKFQPGLATYKANEKGDEFEFYIETFGQMQAMDILTRALDLIKSEVKDISKELKK